MLLHPSDSKLNRFADGDGSGRQRRRTANHLAGCDRCRRTVTGIRDLGRQARRLTPPPLPGNLRMRVVRSLSAGERAIIPTADPTWRARRAPRSLWVGAGMALIIVVAGINLLTVSELRSNVSELSFRPEKPEAGAEIEVTYRGAGRFGGAERLKLRARYRRSDDTPSNRSPHLEAGWLIRQSDGTYRGMIELPRDVVYGVFAVENEHGTVVDSRGYRGWELLTHVGETPQYEALIQRLHTTIGRDWMAAIQTARRVTELYPNRPEAWVSRGALESEAFGATAYDSLRSVYVVRVRDLSAVLAERHPSTDDLGWMQLYAAMWAETAIAQQWSRQLLDEAPTSSQAVLLRTLEVISPRPQDPVSQRAALEALEGIWEQAGPVHVFLPQEAFSIARDAGDTATAHDWAKRWLQVQPWRRHSIAKQMAAWPELSGTAVNWLAQEASALGNPTEARRMLHRTADAQRQVDGDQRRRLLGDLGVAMIVAGDLTGGAALLDSAVASGWSTELMRHVAETRVALGDTAGAAEMWARLAVDPGYGRADSLGHQALRFVSRTEWDRQLERARTIMVAETMRQARLRALPGPLRVVDSEGSEQDLRTLVGGRVTVVAFWSQECPPCTEELRHLQRLSTSLPQSTQIVVLGTGPLSSQAWSRLRADGIELMVLADAYGDAKRAFDVWESTGYAVLDRAGHLRFTAASLDAVARQVVVLALSVPAVT